MAGVDLRELTVAARRGLLTAATRFNRSRGGAGASGAPRLYVLAEHYIQMALRDVLLEVRRS